MQQWLGFENSRSVTFHKFCDVSDLACRVGFELPCEMEFSKLDHVAIVATDSEVSKNWYIDVLGMECVFQGRWDNNPFFLKKGDCYVAIFQAGKQSVTPERKGSRIDHFAFRMESRECYEAAKKELTTKGVTFEEADHDVAHSIYFDDPDGITVELTTYALHT